MMLWLIFGIFFILSLIAGSRLKSKFTEYSAIPTANGMSGAEVSALVPLQNISATILNMIFIGMFFGSFLLGSLFSMQTAPLIIVACYGVFTLFAFITLPVEFDASSRALAWIQRTGITDYYSRSKAEKALRLAASTYVIAALYSLATLLYYLFALLGHSDE